MNLYISGFRDLECFNQVLLAKKALSILSRPSVLLSKFLSSRYFPDGNFLSAPLDERPSFAWRSLLYGRELLQQGLIGNGINIKVWTDKWIDDPIEGLRAPWRKNYYFNVNLSADALIDHDSRR